MKTPVQTFHAGIALGMSLLTAIRMVAQDVMGLDTWVNFISSSWVSIPWGVGLFCILMSITSYFVYRKQIR